MPEQAKETVIIVHGTWAAPEKAKRRWFEPIDGRPGGEHFTAKLDAALHERGSSAQCWAHCTKTNEVFHWSGENSWIARTRAASALGSYVAKVRKEGWLCHIVAHSHGGNIVVEALPQIMIPTSSSSGAPYKIVTLGTPFIDTISPILEGAKRTQTKVNIMSSIAVAATISAIIKFLNDEFSMIPNGIVTAVSFLLTLLLYLKAARTKQTELVTGSGTDQTQPILLAIGSSMDEAWQILHHMGKIADPLAVKSSLLSYVWSSLRLNISLRAEIDRIHGAKSYHDLGTPTKAMLFVVHLIGLFGLYGFGFFLLHLPFFRSTLLDLLFIFFAFIAAPFGFVLFIAAFLGKTWYSAFLSPIRQIAGSLLVVGSLIVTYFVRRKSWPILLKLAMGLEGYRLTAPLIERRPSESLVKSIKYEDMPRGAEQRALALRDAWIARHLGHVTETFSKLAVTTADMSSLLKTVEQDQTLVHAAYYTDDECIARIADWIAGKG
jgi:hypothetical protein